MSGAFTMPHSLTGGAGYKANPSYDEFLRKHSGFYRRHSAASNAQEGDRRASQASIDALAAQAVQNVEAENAAGRKGSVGGGLQNASGGAATVNSRKGSVGGGLQNASGGAATVNSRKGSVVVASDSDRRDSLVGMEATAGTNMDQGRRGSTSLAGDLYRKMKGEK
ncbi:hypothetical protein OHC33_003203 [Knufia fluminis]|uniref:Uncharacterized protein n=1 Tax=Knufia fluminis TaxID=191047 RepID=A0AAN8I5I9_9EURO|nr:hypothetical protein OHC33_003203 [Knufia fluminis]